MAEDSVTKIKGSPTINAYTVMVGVALVALICGVVVVWMQNVKITGNLGTQATKQMKSPFYLVQDADLN